MLSINDFKELVWDYYTKHSRDDLPWRQPEQDGVFDPYKIMVSEIMLQQTQVGRVITKYVEFIDAFPSISSLSHASFADVLKVWSGLGYNRRANYLLQAAKKVETVYEGRLPDTLNGLIDLPGVGPNTAAATMVYAYNQPQVFIETNIRSVFIHHFFNDADQVGDTELIPYIQDALEAEHPREWYWALMDYGTYLKSTTTNPSRRSKHYSKQSKFEGSTRQLRATVLKLLLNEGMTRPELITQTKDNRTEEVLKALNKEGLIIQKNKRYYLA